MSVIKSKRNQSSMEFLDTASRLNLFTIRTCLKFPKRYTFYISQDIAAHSREILDCVKRGNSVYPTNAEEVQRRRNYFLQARESAHGMISLINDARELFHIPGNTMTAWMEMVLSEINLINGILASDKRQYKKFADTPDPA